MLLCEQYYLLQFYFSWTLNTKCTCNMLNDLYILHIYIVHVFIILSFFQMAPHFIKK